MIMNNTWYSTSGTCRTSWTRRCSVRARYPFRASSLVTKTMAVFVTLRMSIADRTLQLCDIEQKRTRFIRLLSCLGTIIYEIFINRSHIAMLSPSSSSGSGLAIDLYSWPHSKWVSSLDWTHSSDTACVLWVSNSGYSYLDKIWTSE